MMTSKENLNQRNLKNRRQRCLRISEESVLQPIKNNNKTNNKYFI